jgi:hypothetical protein
MKYLPLRTPVLLFFALLSIHFSISAQEKVTDIQAQTENLISSLERISVNEIKLQVIAERTASIPQEELEQSEIPALVEKYSNDKQKAERRVISIEHYLKSVNSSVEIPEGRYNKLSDNVKAHIQKEPLYIITTSSN